MKDIKKKINTEYNDAQMLRWYSDVFSSLESAEIIFKDIKENLKTTPHPYCGWRSTPNQNYNSIFINKFGLRSPEIDFDINRRDICIILGGSVAWGFGASQNKFTPSYQIQKYFDANSLDFEVVNLSQNSTNSHDELRTFISSVDEIKPKMVISLSGMNDYWQLKKLEKTGFSKIQDLHTEVSNFFQWGQKLGIATEKNSFKKLLKIFIRYFKKYKTEGKNFYQFKSYSDTPFELFSHKIDVMKSYCESKKIKMVHILQPNLFLKKYKSETEKKYLDFFKENYNDSFNENSLIEYCSKLKKKYFNNKENTDYSLFIDSSNFFDDIKNSIFFDTIHIGDFGNKIIAEKTVAIIKKELFK